MDERPPKPPSSGLRMLVADDSAVNRMIIDALLRGEGHEVLQARDGVEAVALFEREQPDIVFLDAVMPNMDGQEACRQIKRLAGARLVPVVFMTALEDDQDLESCVEAGADDFLTKPVDDTMVRAKLRLLNRMREVHFAVQHRDRISPAPEQRHPGVTTPARGPVTNRSRVLVVDDSALMRQVLHEILSTDPGLEVVGTAADAFIAWEKIQQLRPDVITLDVEMPRMDGIAFLERLMRLRPMPVVMISSLTEKGCQTTLRALSLGAIDFVAKPRLDPLNGTLALADEVVSKVKAAARARLRMPVPTPAVARLARCAAAPGVAGQRPIVVIGASTGGTRAIEELLSALPEDAPGMVIVQHMPKGFTAQFAQRLDGLCGVSVKEAADGDAVRPGLALIAPGDFHVELQQSGADIVVRTSVLPPVNGHRPSVDVLFNSCARVVGAGAVGVILTGMGADGARGLLALRQAGARTLAQDEATCVVFGMPREAIACGAVDEVLPLDRLAAALLRRATRAA